MARFSVTLIAAGLVLTSAALASTSETRDEAAIVGKWKIISIQEDGRASEPRDGDQNAFDGTTFVHLDRGVQDPLVQFTYRIDATPSPKTIDLAYQGTQPAALGLYELNGDRLSLCFRRPTEIDRWPTKIGSKPGSGQSVLVLERQK